MRKLNQIQKTKIEKEYPTMAYAIIKWVEKVGDENEDLQNDIQFAKDIIWEKQ
jgi:hypothetical protein